MTGRTPGTRGHPGAVQARRGTVRRWGLLARLARMSRDVRLVLLVAPPGYGKSTALAQWAEVEDRRTDWVQLDAADDDPAMLVAHIAIAAMGEERAASALPSLLASAREGRTREAAVGLARALGSDEPRVLVLDDLHLVRRRAALEVVVELATELPPGCVLATGSQWLPRVPIGRLRSEGRILELGPADLALDEEEAADLLRRFDLQVADADLRRVVEVTEGWPAGASLAGLALASRRERPGALDTISGEERYFVDYFLDVLARQSADTVRFLLRTSVLDRMCASLCDAVLDTTGSAAFLAEIATLNLFLVAEDDRRQWYRYHRLFAQALRSELRRREPGEDVRIHRRAADWFEERGRPDEAVRQALAGEDARHAARLITAHTQRLNSEGRIGLVREWLEAMDERAITTYPPLAAMGTWIWALNGDGPRAAWALHHAETGHFDGPMPDGSASLASAVHRARAALAPFGLVQMREDAETAMRLEPPGSDWYPLSALLRGTACMLLGQWDEAVPVLERAGGLGRDIAGPGRTFAVGERGLLAADSGDWPTATACAEQARAVVDSTGLHGSVTSLPTYVLCARVALHRGDERAAGIDAAVAMRLYRRPSPAAFPWLAAQMAVLLGEMLLALGDESGAQLKATEAGRHLPLLGPETVLLDRHRRLLADLDLRHAHPAEGGVLTAAELRILPLLPTHLSLADIAAKLVLSRNTVKTQVAGIYRKLDARNRAEAVRRATELGLLEHEVGMASAGQPSLLRSGGRRQPPAGVPSDA